MSLTLAGRLFHNVGAVIWNDLSPRVFLFFPWATEIVVLQKNEAGIYISPLIERDCRYRTAHVDILPLTLKLRF